MRLEPIWVASLILCASPPESVPELLDSVRYPSPTSSRNLSLEVISLSMSLAISASFSLSLSPLKNFMQSETDISVTSMMDLSAIVTARALGLRRFPLQDWHSEIRMNFSSSFLRYSDFVWE